MRSFNGGMRRCEMAIWQRKRLVRMHRCIFRPGRLVLLHRPTFIRNKPVTGMIGVAPPSVCAKRSAEEARPGARLDPSFLHHPVSSPTRRWRQG